MEHATHTQQKVPVSGEPGRSGGEHRHTRPRDTGRQFSLDNIINPIEETIERTFSKFMNRGWLKPGRDDRNLWREMFEPLSQFDAFSMRWPKIDVVDQENEVLVRAELPGVDKKDIDVSLSDNMLTLRGQTRHEEKVEKDNYYRSEISQGSFMRSVYLPIEVDSVNAAASLRDGILEVRLPKVPSSKRKTIQVQ